MKKLTGQAFKVPILLASNTNTGEAFILRTHEEIQELTQVALADVDERMDALTRAGTVDAIVAARKRLEIANVEANIARQTAEIEAAMPRAVKHDHTLIKPSYGEYSEAEGQATVYTFDDMQFDQRKFIDILFARSIEGLDDEGFDKLDPAIGRELRFRFQRSLFPDSKRLPFT